MSLRVNQNLDDVNLDDYFTWVQMVWVNARDEPLNFSEHKYLVDIYKDQWPQIVYQKAAQMGLSEKLISEAIWICDRLSKNVLYVTPTSSQLNDFVQARLEPIFMFSDYLSRITGVLSADQKRSKNLDEGKKVQKVGLKQIRNSFLYLRGSQNQQQIISVDADAIILDERDRFIQEHVSYIDKRLLHSTLKWRREASTPTFPGMGVNEVYMQSDQRIWMLKCEFCGMEQELDFFLNIDFDKEIAVCRQCTNPINRLKDGHWVAQVPANSAIHGYKINGIYNSRRSIPELIEAYDKAQLSGFAAMQQFYNQVLGLPYEATGKTLTKTELEDCTKNYMAPFETSDTFAGFDVGEVIHGIVSKRFEGKDRYVWIGTVKNFSGPNDSVEALISKYNIQTLVIDAKPETRKVKELVDKYPNKVFAAYYPTRKFDVQNYYMFDEFKYEVYIDRTISLDYLINDIQNAQIELPSNAKDISGFYDHMTSSTRQNVINPRTGQPNAVWIQKGPDHFLHAANYNRLATLKGAVGQALLESYNVDKTKEQPFVPDSLNGWASLVRSGGVRLNG